MKLICRSLGVLESKKFTTPKGNGYYFHKGMPTEVKDKDDLKHFAKFDSGQAFMEYGGKPTPKGTLDVILDPENPISRDEFLDFSVEKQVELVKELDPQTKVSKRTALGRRVDVFLKLQEEKLSVEEEEGEEEPEEEEDDELSEEEAYALNKDEQIKLIKDLDPEAEIPRLEKGRVELILKLQKR